MKTEKLFSARVAAYIITAVFIILGITCRVLAQTEQPKAPQAKEVMESKEAKQVQGEVSGISKKYISIIYQRDETQGIEYEMALPLDDGVRLVHKKNLAEIKRGDIITIDYEQITKEKEGVVSVDNKTKTVTFVKPATPELKTVETGALPLKGMK